MSRFLVIRLPSREDDPVRWVAVEANGALAGEPGRGTLDDAARAAQGAQPVAIVPAGDVLRTSADVPVKGTARLLQALPFALEEQLADAVEDLHFAATVHGPGTPVAVAAVRRDRLAGWLASLEAAGLVPERMYAAGDGLAGVPNTSTLLVEAGEAVLVHPDGTAAAVDTDDVGTLLGLWLDQAAAEADGTPVPRHLLVLAEAESAASLQPLWEGLRPRLGSLDLRALGPEGALPRLAAQLVTSPGVNLLQGPYARHSGFGAFWPAWRTAAALLALFAGALLLSDGLELLRLRREGVALDQRIAQAFNYTFPGSGPLKDPAAQVEARLRALGSGGVDPRTSHEFLDALRAVAQAIATVTGTRIEGLNYRTGSLELRMRAPGVDALDRVQKLISQGSGLRAELQSTNAEGNEVRGRIQVRRATGG